MGFLKIAVFALIASIDLASYCKGFCISRYQDGAYSPEHKMCQCIDYFSAEINHKLEVPKKAKTDFEAPAVYDGKDQMHYAPAEPEYPIPTAPMGY